MAARLPDISTIVAAGFDPVTGLPIKFGSGMPEALKEDIRKSLRIQDEQQAINRYVWYNLPSGLDGQMLERMLYYKGQLAFFYVEANQRFYLLPYALNGTIDCYGRFMGITPVAFGTGKEDKFLFGKDFVRKPIYDIADVELEDIMKTIREGCVLLYDYSKQYSETIIPRQIINDPIVSL